MQHFNIFTKPFLGIACLVLFLGARAAFAQTLPLFGDGSDKDVSIAVTTTLTRDMYYHNLRIKTGRTLNTGGYRVFVSGTLTLDSGARLSRDGNGSTGNDGGAALSRGTLGGSGRGAIDQDVANSLGGSGGGADIGWGSAANPPDPSVGGGGVFRSALQAISGRSLDGALVNGGAGGGANGGGGGGVVVVVARTIVVNGDGATISANGGHANSGFGGGGGVVVVISTTAQPANLVLSANGGLGYAGAPGTNGADGFTSWLSSATATSGMTTETPTSEPIPVEPPTVNPPPATPTISPRQQQTICNGGITLTSSSSTGNQWYLDGNAIVGATSQQHVAQTPGAYTVVVTTGGSSSAASAATIVLVALAPELSYRNQRVIHNDDLLVKPVVGSQTRDVVFSLLSSTITNGISLNPATGVVLIDHATPAGATHTVTIRAKNRCGAITDATFTVYVDPH